MADTDPLSLFVNARDRFVRCSVLLTGLALTAAGASRIPTWEVKAPVEWLAGTLNVGFLPIFGPILVLFGYCYLYLAWRAMVATATAVPFEGRGADGPLGPTLADTRIPEDRRTAFAVLLLRAWTFVVPIVAYAILVSTYFEFCAASPDPQEQVRLCTGGRRVLTLGIGIDGWTGFKPRLASIQDNLSDVAQSRDTDEKARLESVADFVPWIYPPLQTWVYVLGLFFMVYLALGVIAPGFVLSSATSDASRPS